MKKIITLALVTLTSSLLYAQQELMVSQYMFNGLVINPAYAGTHEYWSASALHRSQWVGFDRAPVSQTLSFEGPVAKRKIGLGLTVSNDKLGITSQLEFGANGNYQLLVGPGTLSLGIRAALATYSADLNETVVWDENDPVYTTNLQGEIVPKFGAGAYYHTQKWYAGFSVPVISAFDNNLISEGSVSDNFFASHMYLNGGVVFSPSVVWAIRPSVLLKYQNAAPLEIDLNCNVLFMQKYWFGVGYRSGDALVAMVEWNITSQLRLGYAYDFTLSDIASYSSGSHEIMLAYDLGRTADVKARSPRYF